MRKNCPVCSNHDLEITRLSCSKCGLSLNGKFGASPLARLAGEETKLAVLMILCGGNLKQLVRKLDITYPTLHKRIDSLIETVKKLCADDEETIGRLLMDMEKGKINAETGIRLIQEIKGET